MQTLSKYFLCLTGTTLITLTSGCATPPQQRPIQNSETYNTDFDVTWAHLMQFFTMNNIQVKTIEKASGVVYAERVLLDVDYKLAADCGSPGLFAIQSTTVGLNVFVVPDAQRTKVTVNTTFTQVRALGQNVVTVPCVSTGDLEKQILQSL